MTHSTAGQLLRFTIVGLGSNMLLYLIYIYLTSVGAHYLASATAVYVLGTLQTFFLNKKWTFANDGDATKLFKYYIALYAGVGITGLLILQCLVVYGDLPHQISQLLVIIVSAFLLFLVQKTYIFR